MFGRLQSRSHYERSVCCLEQDKVTARAATQDGIKCITEHDGFSAVCLNEHVLLDSWRGYTAYRQFVRWCYQFLGRHFRLPLPAVGVHAMRNRFICRVTPYSLEWKCGIFGVSCEGLPRQINFLIDEGHLISKGSNAVVSYLHYFFERFGLGETDADLIAAN